MRKCYLEDRPRRRREVQLHGTRIPQKMSEQQCVAEWRNENKQLAGEVGHRKESVSEESPLLQRRFPMRGEAAAGRRRAMGGLLQQQQNTKL